LRQLPQCCTAEQREPADRADLDSSPGAEHFGDTDQRSDDDEQSEQQRANAVPRTGARCLLSHRTRPLGY
jgi:hypothetical protein